MVTPSAASRPRGIALPRNEWDRLDGVRPDEPPLVSVIIAHYEQQSQLDRTLLALRRQDHPPERLEIIVVDDGSITPPTVPDGVILIVQEDRGFRLAAARNAGVARASGRILCFLDADTAPEPSYLTELTRLPALAPDVVTVGRRLHAVFDEVDADARIEVVAPLTALPAPRWLDDAYARSRNLLDADDRSYRFVIGAVVACSAELFDASGGFDESFDRYGGEDWEWAYRAWLAGAVLAHVPTAIAWHDGPEWSGRPEAALARKNEESVRLAELIPVPGSGPRGLRGRFADVLVSVPDGVTAPEEVTGWDAAWFVTLDSLAEALPLAGLPGVDASSAKCRILVDVLRPLRVRGSALAEAVVRLGAESLGSLEVVDADDGEPLCVVRSTRAAARASRWGQDDLFERASVVLPGAAALDPAAVDVEAYLGGWG